MKIGIILVLMAFLNLAMAEDKCDNTLTMQYVVSLAATGSSVICANNMTVNHRLFCIGDYIKRSWGQRDVKIDHMNSEKDFVCIGISI